MKKLLPAFTLLSTVAFGQVYTSTGSGNFFNPLLWDCFCVPGDGDSLVINHSMELTASIYYTTGQIKIGPSGSLTEDGTDRDVWVNGGSLINNGVFDCYRLYLSNGSSFENSGTSVYFDSLWNQAAIINTGTITVYDILNDQAGNFNNSGDFVVENNFNNQGGFINNSSAVIDVYNDFSNCNIQSMDAMFINDGTFCIGYDFVNCVDDTLDGSGWYFIGGGSSNFGAFEGTFQFNTPTGSLSANTGTIDPGVTFGTDPCELSIKVQENVLSIYPNPAYNVLYINATNFTYGIFDLSGKLVQQNTGQNAQIDISAIAPGVYTINLVDVTGNVAVQKFVKK